MNRRQLRLLRWIILFVLIGYGLAAATAAVALSDQNLGGLFLNLGTELIGATITYCLFELLIEKEIARESRKEGLIRHMGSIVREVAVPAVDDLREQGWITDGSLRGVDLRGAELSIANLKEADLRYAKLERTWLWEANLEKPNLLGANLREANLRDTNLRQVNLRDANLEGADLRAAHMKGASLLDANLKRTNLGRDPLRENEVTEITKEQLAQAETLRGASCSLDREETE